MYHQLIINGDFKKGCTVEDYDLNDFDLFKFWSQGHIENIKLSDLELDIGAGEVSDYLPSPISVPFVSSKFRAYIEKWSADATFVDLSPAIRSSKINEQFWLLCFNNTYTKEKGMSLGLDIFRSNNEAAGEILFSDAAAKGLKFGSFKGLAFLRQ